jgi:ABC-type amino acid transport substrate-binding protein
MSSQLFFAYLSMLKKYLQIFVISFLALMPLNQAFSAVSADLSPEESEWIMANPEIRVGNELDWPPFDFAEDGVAKGYSIDLMKLIADKVGMQLKFVNGYSWSELLEMFKKRVVKLLLLSKATITKK